MNSSKTIRFAPAGLVLAAFLAAPAAAEDLAGSAGHVTRFDAQLAVGAASHSADAHIKTEAAAEASSSARAEPDAEPLIRHETLTDAEVRKAAQADILGSVAGAVAGGITSGADVGAVIDGPIAEKLPATITKASSDQQLQAALSQEIGNEVAARASGKKTVLLKQIRVVKPGAEIRKGFEVAGQVETLGTMKATEAKKLLVRTAGHTEARAAAKLARFQGDLFVAKTELRSELDESTAQVVALVGLRADGRFEVAQQMVTAVDGVPVVGLDEEVRAFGELEAEAWAKSLS